MHEKQTDRDRHKKKIFWTP